MTTVRVTWIIGNYNKSTIGVPRGITLWSPPRIRRKYPYIACDYSKVKCEEWVQGICSISVAYLDIGEIVYLSNMVQETRHFVDWYCGLYKVKPGSKITLEDTSYMYEAENLEILEDKRSIRFKAPRLIREARKREWNISRSNFEKNLLAIYLVVEGLVPETPINIRTIEELKHIYTADIGHSDDPIILTL